ncbi:Flp family type IVb pilin [Dongia sedimenti]|uniref:Flp family type IVb pilin n=1 Tax=Dongia sedimenti TaxID=3064282 RepID=A0ABU0YQ93_9PROT|nr:Flp family type IVb pilin [Rhodospirillaceae bacterium R-7]
MPESLDGAVKSVRNGFGRAETGATAIEYALIAALVSTFIVASLILTGNNLSAVYTVINNAMVGAFGN